MKNTYHELLCVKNDIENGDFNSENSKITIEDRKGFLNEYVKVAKQWFGENANLEKVNSEEELLALEPSVFDDQEYEGNVWKPKTVSAYTKQKSCAYKNWMIYNRISKVNGNTLVLQDNELDIGCAKLDLKKTIKEFSTEILIDESYYTELVRVSVVGYGRILEFRKGVKEVAKFQFWANGDLIYFDGRLDPYHPECITIKKGGCVGNKVNIKVRFEDEIIVTVNGEETRLPSNRELTPDTVYFGGGRLPRTFWSITPKKVVFADGTEETEFFKKASNRTYKEEYIGEKALPFGIATTENKDKYLILRSKFTPQENKKAIFELQSLDPIGRVYLNKKLIYTANTFMATKLDITKYLIKGENEIELKVDPRAPEVHYLWHRHQDPHNGWFALPFAIRYVEDEKIDYVKITTKSLKEKVTFTVAGNINKNSLGKMQIFVRERGEGKKFALLDEFNLNGKKKFNKEYSGDYKLWSDKAPNLYIFKFVMLTEKGVVSDENIIETGFRTIEQKNGKVYLNGKLNNLYGALIMQFLPPYKEVPLNHVLPSNTQIIHQVLCAKKMGGNAIRMHQLGYGTNEKRFADACNRLGIMVCWTTRLLDALEILRYEGEWHQKKAFIQQIKEVINAPAIIMWEGSNEFHAVKDIKLVDRMYDNFIDAVKPLDKSRLLNPVSEIYYKGDCKFYNDAGDLDIQDLNHKVRSSYGWIDKLVIRTAHPYSELLGYGAKWDRFRRPFPEPYAELFVHPKRAFLITEFAIIGRANPNVEESKVYFKGDSYELPNELDALGFITDEPTEWEMSQAYQAHCATHACKHARYLGADGLFWCALQSGANDGSYAKPPIDFYGYKKTAFYALKEGYQPYYTTVCGVDVFVKGKQKIDFALNCDSEEGTYNIKIVIKNSKGKVIKEKNLTTSTNRRYKKVCSITLPKKEGYYAVETTTEKV